MLKITVPGLTMPLSVNTELPVLFFDDRDGEWSVMLPTGMVISDQVAEGWDDTAVKTLGKVAGELNQPEPYCAEHDLFNCWVHAHN